MALIYTPSPDLGRPCPDFDLPATDQKKYSRHHLLAGQKPFVIAFICNHCPYVIAIQDRLVQLGTDLQSLGIPMLAINSNDAQRYPEDSFEKMQKISIEKNYSFPYLYDESQKAARDFGAVCTPDFFVYDHQGKLAYRGRLDDSWKDPSKVTRRELFEAVKMLNQNLDAPSNQAPSMGCSLKWKEEQK